MAKGKKASGKKYVSKGERPSVKTSTTKAVARSLTSLDKISGILRGYDRGENPWITVANPNTKETHKKFIRVRANTLFTGDNNRDNVYKMNNS
jgi:hypothetical protein